MDNLHQHSGPLRTTPRNLAHSPTPDPPSSATHRRTSATITPSLTQRLQDARARQASAQADSPRSQPQPERPRDDWIFDSEDDTPNRRRRRAPQVSRVASAHHNTDNTARRSSQGVALSTRDMEAKMDRLSKENFDFRLKLTLLEEKNTKLKKEVENVIVVNKVKCDKLEQELDESYAVNDELVAELKQRDTELEESCDMYCELEQKASSMAQELESYRGTPRSEKNSVHEKDSAYYSSDAQSLSTTSPDGFPRPSTAASPPSTVESSPQTLSKLPRPRNYRIRQFADSLIVNKSRTSELEKRASFHSLASEATAALQDAIRSESPNTTTPTRRALSRNFGSGTILGSQTSLGSAGSTASRARGLRTLYITQEHAGSTSSIETTQHHYGDALSNVTPTRAPSDTRPRSPVLSESDSFTGALSGPESLVFSDDDLGSLTDGASDDLPASLTMSNLSIHDDAHSDKIPTPTTLSDVSKVPTEYQPGQYPRWPVTRMGLGQDMFFNGEGLGEMPRRRGML